jgi:hypothetical protein
VLYRDKFSRLCRKLHSSCRATAGQLYWGEAAFPARLPITLAPAESPRGSTMRRAIENWHSGDRRDRTGDANHRAAAARSLTILGLPPTAASKNTVSAVVLRKNPVFPSTSCATQIVSRIFRTFGWLSGTRPWLTRKWHLSSVGPSATRCSDIVRSGPHRDRFY